MALVSGHVRWVLSSCLHSAANPSREGSLHPASPPTDSCGTPPRTAAAIHRAAGAVGRDGERSPCPCYVCVPVMYHTTTSLQYHGRPTYLTGKCMWHATPSSVSAKTTLPVTAALYARCGLAPASRYRLDSLSVYLWCRRYALSCQQDMSHIYGVCILQGGSYQPPLV